MTGWMVWVWVAVVMASVAAVVVMPTMKPAPKVVTSDQYGEMAHKTKVAAAKAAAAERMVKKS